MAEKIWKIRIFNTKPLAAACLHSSQSTEKNQNLCLSCDKILGYMNINLSKRDLGKIVILLICASLILAFQEPIFATMHRSAEILPKEVGGYMLKFIGPSSENYTKLMGFEELLYYIYLPRNNSEERLQVMVNFEIAKSWSVFHSWEVSLISWRKEHNLPPGAAQIHDVSKRPREVHLLKNPPILGLFSAFRDPNLSSNLTLTVLELGPIDLKEVPTSNSTTASEQKFAKLTLYTLTNDPEHFYEIEDALLSFGEAIVNNWQPAGTWSSIALTLSQNGETLMIITAALLVTILVTALLENLKLEKSNLIVYRKLASKEEQSVIQAVLKVSRNNEPTTSKVASCYQKLTGKPIEINLLLEKLKEAEKAGLVEKDIVSLEDEPVVTWKSRVRFHKSIL